jgi:hypothetical protein
MIKPISDRVIWAFKSWWWNMISFVICAKSF